MNPHPLSGIIPPLVTPLHAKLSLDKHGLVNLIEHVIAGGVRGIFLMGSTGEGPALNNEIREEVIRESVKTASGRIPVFVNISSASFHETKATVEFAAREGADYGVLSPPFYFDMNRHELINYYSKLAEQSPLPLLIYNAPKYTKISIPPEFIREFATHPNIAGIKDSSGSLPYIKDLIQARGERHFPILIGPEPLLGEALQLGCEGGVCGGANLYPSLYVNYHKAVREQNQADMERCQHQIRLIQSKLYAVPQSPLAIVIALKHLLAHRGLCGDQMSMPVFETLTREQKTTMESLDKEIRQL